MSRSGARGGASSLPDDHDEDEAHVTLLAVYTHKGGTGKTTCAANVGAILAKDHTVVLVDADPQMSLTTQYAEDAMIQRDEESQEADGSSEDEGGEEEADGGAAAPGDEGASEERLVLPPLKGDQMRKPDALQADVFQGIKEWCADKDDLFTALKNTVRREDYVPKPTVVNNADYKGRLLLLPGSDKLHRFSHDLEKNVDTSWTTHHFGAFRKAMLGMARSVGASFVIVDLGPHTDTLHKVIITSCHAIQPVVGACIFSCFSTRTLLHEVLPEWIRWHREFWRRHQQPAEYAYSSRFPRILPFLGWDYEMKGGKVQWSSSNFFESLRQIIEGERAVDAEPLPAEVLDLYVPCRKSANSRETRMLVPIVKHLAFLPVAQECGRAIFDLNEKNLQDYYQLANVGELEPGKLEAEKQYVLDRLRPMARCLVALHKYLRVREMRDAEQRREREAAAAMAAAANGAGGSGRKRVASAEAGGPKRRKARQPARVEQQ